jgi:hypothetical protein
MLSAREKSARTGWHNNDNQEDDDSDNQTHAHLHVLPPHLLSDSIGATTEALSRDCQVVGLILQRIQSLASLGYFVDVFSHNADGVIDLLFSQVSRCSHATAQKAAETLAQLWGLER